MNLKCIIATNARVFLINLRRVLDDDVEIGMRRLAIFDIKRPEVREGGRRDDNHVNRFFDRRRIERTLYDRIRDRHAQALRLFKRPLNAIPTIRRHFQKKRALARQRCRRGLSRLTRIRRRAEILRVLFRGLGCLAEKARHAVNRRARDTFHRLPLGINRHRLNNGVFLERFLANEERQIRRAHRVNGRPQVTTRN